MARNTNGREAHALANLLDLPADLSTLKVAELKALCQRFNLMDRVIASGSRLNVKASYIEVLNEAKASNSSTELNDCPNCDGTGEEKSVYGNVAYQGGYSDHGHTVYELCSECGGMGKLTNSQLASYLGISDEEGESENPGDREDDDTALADGNSPIQSEGECNSDRSEVENDGEIETDDTSTTDQSEGGNDSDIVSLSEWLERAQHHYASEYGKQLGQIQILPIGETLPGDEWGADDAISYPPDPKQGYRVWVCDDDTLKDSVFDAVDAARESEIKLQKWTEEQTLVMAQKYQISPERVYLSLAFVGQELGSGWIFKETLRYDEFTEIAVYLLRDPLGMTPIDDEKPSSPIPLKLTELIDPLSSVKPILDAPQLAPHRQELERILGGLSPQGQVIAAEGFLLGSLEWIPSVSPLSETRLLSALNRGIELIAGLQVLRKSPENFENFKQRLADFKAPEPVEMNN